MFNVLSFDKEPLKHFYKDKNYYNVQGLIAHWISLSLGQWAIDEQKTWHLLKPLFSTIVQYNKIKIGVIYLVIKFLNTYILVVCTVYQQKIAISEIPRIVNAMFDVILLLFNDEIIHLF